MTQVPKLTHINHSNPYNLRYGGDAKFHNADRLTEWKESLGERPQLLATEMSHTRISHVVGMVSKLHQYGL